MTDQATQEAGRRLRDLADTIIEDCHTWIRVAETRADITPPLDAEAFRLAKARALQVKAAVGKNEPIPRDLMDSMFQAFAEGCKQR